MLPRITLAVALLLAAAPALAADPAGTARQDAGQSASPEGAKRKDAPGNPADEAGQFAYTIGYHLGMNAQRQGFAVNPEIAAQGFRDALAGAGSKLTPEQMATVLEGQARKLTEQKQAQAAANLKTGQAFLEENKKKPDIKTTASGLQYKIIEPGKGRKPGPQDSVTVHYRGTLISGKEFDSSAKHGKPISFKVGDVIKGWQEAVQLLHEGGKMQAFIPSELAYGAGGAPGAIGPNETLIFDIELVSVTAAK
jgi:FKBP-type peptidyl-prolyl cis-trans isomerase FklB